MLWITHYVSHTKSQIKISGFEQEFPFRLGEIYISICIYVLQGRATCTLLTNQMAVPSQRVRIV